MSKKRHDSGFSLVEVLVGLFLVGVAVLGLAQLFLVSVTNNLRADRIASATYLAQQQIDWLRGFTYDELMTYGALPLTGRDEALDINLDGKNDYRRITELTMAGTLFQIRVLVYSSEVLNVADPQELVDDVDIRRVRALISTIISR